MIESGVAKIVKFNFAGLSPPIGRVLPWSDPKPKSTIKAPQKIIHLPIPPGPVVINIMAPVVDPGRDGFFSEQIVQVTGIFNGFILPGALPHTNDNPAAAVLLQVPRIRQVP